MTARETLRTALQNALAACSMLQAALDHEDDSDAAEWLASLATDAHSALVRPEIEALFEGEVRG